MRNLRAIVDKPLISGPKQSRQCFNITLSLTDTVLRMYCIYDRMHDDYGYTQAWVGFLIEKLKDPAEFDSLYNSTQVSP